MALSSEALRVFLAVVDTGSMSAAAEFLGQTASGVSRGLSRLETQLGVTLLTRTTRRMELTDEGQLFLQRARRIVAELDDAEECMRIRLQQPAGKLRIDASAPVMLHCVVPHVGEFRARYPEISLELTSNDRIVDLLEHRTDIALRAGPLSDSSLHARPLRPAPRFLVASPAYVARRGAPATPEALAGHELLGFTQPETLNVWPLRHAGGTGLAIAPTLAASSGETQRQLALGGVGIACLSEFMVRDDLASGRLVKVLEHAYTDYLQPMHAVYYRNTQLARRIACFLDFFAERI
ncbi:MULTISPECIES: LysR family transcriptional regulator [Bordetella]|uniref:LysR family transcriptional regulator n=1 Tax=Bordetella genomosp. 2 TaxID=1983456 RepID=A0A261V747_9BORD|nr:MULTISPECIES: LysR family transcriptional regulator [Bordetella]OZI69400.1 LysR family transcriptional regulator [Bordetella genomosp. 2]